MLIFYRKSSHTFDVGAVCYIDIFSIASCDASCENKIFSVAFYYLVFAGFFFYFILFGILCVTDKNCLFAVKTVFGNNIK